MLRGKTALVTGASRGLGLAIAKELSSRGSNVIIMARDKGLLQHNVAHELTGDSHSFIQCDLRDMQQLKQVSKNPLIKDLSIVVHCAGVSQASLLSTTPLPEIENLITTNLTGPIVLTQSLIRPLIKNSPSSVTFLSSVIGLKGLRGTSVYGATKAGLQGFTKSMAREMGKKHVRFNCVSPGLVKSTSMGSGYHFDTALDKDSVAVEEVVQSVMLMIENDGITGQNIVVDNGYVC